MQQLGMFSNPEPILILLAGGFATARSSFTTPDSAKPAASIPYYSTASPSDSIASPGKSPCLP